MWQVREKEWDVLRARGLVNEAELKALATVEKKASRARLAHIERTQTRRPMSTR